MPRLFSYTCRGIAVLLFAISPLGCGGKQSERTTPANSQSPSPQSQPVAKSPDTNGKKVNGKSLDEWINVLKTSPDEMERASAAQSIGEFKEAAGPAIPALAEALKKQKGQVSYYAAGALGKI